MGILPVVITGILRVVLACILRAGLSRFLRVFLGGVLAVLPLRPRVGLGFGPRLVRTSDRLRGGRWINSGKLVSGEALAEAMDRYWAG